MKAIVFAAGLGTRIQEISKGKPKALLEINNRTLLEHAISYLAHNGISEVIVNIHHKASLMKRFINETAFPIPVNISDESNQLLDTGGGLLKAKPFLEDDDFLVYNVDILTDLDLDKMIEFHKSNKAIATLAVRRRDTLRYLLFNKDLEMKGWENIKTKEQILHSEEPLNQYAFSGIHILSPQIFELLEKEKKDVFSITKTYIKLSKDFKIQAFPHDKNYWFDVGKVDSYKEASTFLKGLL